MPWKIVAASAQGTSHAARGQGCQDTYAFEISEPWFVGVVCDGAGSARLSALGATHAAQRVVKHLASYLTAHPDVIGAGRRAVADSLPAPGPDANVADAGHVTATPAPDSPLDASATPAAGGSETPSPEPVAPEEVTAAEAALRSVVAAAIAEARDTVLALAPEDGATLADFSATLVGCAAWPDGGLFFHIGDGAALALDAASLEVLGLSPPENGEFAEQTFFYTGDAWREHLRFTPVPAGANLIALMSDGTMTFAIASNRRDVDRRFFAPVTKFLLRDDVTPEAGATALHSTLSSPGACRVTHDDKTLLWAHLSLATPAASTPTESAERSGRTGA